MNELWQKKVDDEKAKNAPKTATTSTQTTAQVEPKRVAQAIRQAPKVPIAKVKIPHVPFFLPTLDLNFSSAIPKSKDEQEKERQELQFFVEEGKGVSEGILVDQVQHQAPSQDDIDGMVKLSHGFSHDIDRSSRHTSITRTLSSAAAMRFGYN